jgi:predicted dehydrogenase
MVNVAVIGCGYWGPNLIRNVNACPDTALRVICDRDPSRLERMSSQYPAAETATDADAVFSRDDVDAVVVATPVRTHFPLVRAALEAGKHALVEKPMTQTPAEAEELVRLADDRHLALMVDHTYLYMGAVRKIKELVESGELGELYFIDSVRINLGLFQHDVNVIWDLAPHDLAIVDYVTGREARSLTATGTAHASNGIEDVAYLSLDLGGSLMANFHVSWLSPVKVRRMIFGGSRKSVIFDDLQPDEKVRVYDRGIEVSKDSESVRSVLVGYRTGDIWVPKLDTAEPLQTMMRHFAECVEKGMRPLSDGGAGARIVRILDAAERSIKAQGGRVVL